MSELAGLFEKKPTERLFMTKRQTHGNSRPPDFIPSTPGGSSVVGFLSAGSIPGLSPSICGFLEE
jgi:hypothetical protein